ncbi:SHOCT domain-containing protein [Thermomicrobium sp. CFH 73360]|uniref:SHOCT domain-containing protein n=1 Tax=Thermomicrobium sp. CFH 73360 TaxID=2951987 RepID=UPI0020775387|nr:SHOCT domain-containing protein [Thermomicrobium sp. CFH 73360]MCM8745980.1 SHOCT domain-containing protein [Thermomicrobium sp. CFH 73360]
MEWRVCWHGPFHAGALRDLVWILDLIGILSWLALLIAVVLLVVWLARRIGSEPIGTPSKRARDILDERYARGEITREQYLEMRRDLEHSG